MVNEDILDISTWASVLQENLSPDKRDIFNKRKKAIEMYISGKYPLKEIYNQTRINDLQIRRLLQRCLSYDQDGVMYGFRALIPYKRIQKNSPIYRPNKTGFANSFNLLLETYPSLKTLIHQLYLAPQKLDSIKISRKELHRKFTIACRNLGIKPDEYPFNTMDVGYRSLARYVTKLEQEHPEQIIKRYGKNHEHTFLDTGGASNNKKMIIRPFERVQLDGHKIDLVLAIKFKTPEGDEFVQTIHRLYILTIIDVATRAILGYHISLGREYNQFDVLKCIKNAIEPRKKMTFSIAGLAYPPNGGYHSLAIPETEWAVWDEILFDNAKSHLANMVRDKLKDTVGCDINFGSVGKPTRRSIIERFFNTLEQNGYHRLTNTTGSNPNDPRRRKAEQQAVKYEITVEKIHEITEIMIANYNNDPHEGINNLTPLEVMEQRIKKGMPIRKMDSEKRGEFELFTIKATRMIQGGIKVGRRPYITFEGVSYTNDILAKSPDLAGTKIDLIINTEDLRVIKAYLQDGSEFGLLTAHGKWGIIQHTLEERKAINKLKRERKIVLSDNQDPIDALNQYLATKAPTDKNARQQLQKTLKKQRQQSDRKDKERKETLHQEIPKDEVRKYEEDHIIQKSLPKLPKSIIY